MTILIPEKNAEDSCFHALYKDGILIGQGGTRDVYLVKDNPDKVIKVSNKPSNFANWSEILVYMHYKDYGQLAEIFSWSWSGKFIVMERLAPLTIDEIRRIVFPCYLTDRKPENYGKDPHDNIKALDYAALKVDVWSLPKI